MQIVIRPAAAADIEDAFVWYEEKRSGLGSDFLKTVHDALIGIRRAPQLHPVIHRNTRRALLRRFPYGIYNRIYPDLIVVVACMHGRAKSQALAIAHLTANSAFDRTNSGVSPLRFGPPARPA